MNSVAAARVERPEPAADAPKTRFVVAAVVVASLAALLFFARLGTRALWSSEGRWAEIAREMQLSSNYFWPTINGQPYYDKPLLSYWLVLAASRLTGAVNETASRLPCAVAGLLSVVLLMAMAVRLFDESTAVWSAFILATSFSFVFFSRHASADVATVAGELGALTLFVYRERRQGGWWVMELWLLMAVTSLIKGLLGFALPLLIIGSYSLLSEGWETLYAQFLSGPFRRRLAWLTDRWRWLFGWKTVPAVLLAVVVYSLPFAISSRRMHSNVGLYMVFRENFIRFFHPFDHRGPIYLYAYVIFALMVPWSLFLPAALVRLHSDGSRAAPAAAIRSDRFVAVYFWATFIFFTLSGSRRSYYLVPILPAAALLVARLFAQKEPLTLWTRRLMYLGYFPLVLGAVVIAAALLMPLSARPGDLRLLPVAPSRTLLALICVPAVAAILYSAIRLSRLSVGLSSAVIAYVALFYVFVVALPGAEPYRGEKPFALGVRADIGDDFGKLALFKIWGPGLVFYLSPKTLIPEYEDPSALRAAIQDGKVRWVITLDRNLAPLPTDGEVLLRETSFPWERPLTRRAKYVLLRFEKS